MPCSRDYAGKISSLRETLSSKSFRASRKTVHNYEGRCWDLGQIILAHFRTNSSHLLSIPSDIGGQRLDGYPLVSLHLMEPAFWSTVQEKETTAGPQVDGARNKARDIAGMGKKEEGLKRKDRRNIGRIGLKIRDHEKYYKICVWRIEGWFI